MGYLCLFSGVTSGGGGRSGGAVVPGSAREGAQTVRQKYSMTADHKSERQKLSLPNETEVAYCNKHLPF